MYTDDDYMIAFVTNSYFPSVFGEGATILTLTPTETKIWQALFSMNGLKAPGPDGFSALFYQNQWSTVKGSLISFFSRHFTKESSINVVNEALISLIPKTPYPENITQFRPTSLCNVNYKIFTKILVQRI